MNTVIWIMMQKELDHIIADFCNANGIPIPEDEFDQKTEKTYLN